MRNCRREERKGREKECARGTDFSRVKSSCLISPYYVEMAKQRRQRAGHYAIIKRGLPERAHCSLYAITISLKSHAGATYQNGAKRPLEGPGPRNCIIHAAILYGGILMHYVDRSCGLFYAILMANNV